MLVVSDRCFLLISDVMRGRAHSEIFRCRDAEDDLAGDLVWLLYSVSMGFHLYFTNTYVNLRTFLALWS